MSLSKVHHQPGQRLQAVYHKALCWVHFCLSSSLTICLMKSNIICELFADDCKLYGADNDDGDNTIQIDLNSLESWSHKWQLPFNAAKCKVMHFGYSNPKREYEMNNVILETSDHEKDLGVIIDDSLKFHVHSAAAIKKARLGLMKKAYTSRDHITISTLYKAMVRPHLEYGNTWSIFTR